MNRLVAYLITLVASVLSLLAISCCWAVERDEAAPICGIVYTEGATIPSVLFANEQIDGLTVRVHSQRGPYPRSLDQVWLKCWWDIRPDQSIPRCPTEFIPQRHSSLPGAGDENVWLLEVAYWKGDVDGEFVFCYDYENPDSTGNPDYIFSWHKPITVLP